MVLKFKYFMRLGEFLDKINPDIDLTDEALVQVILQVLVITKKF